MIVEINGWYMHSTIAYILAINVYFPRIRYSMPFSKYVVLHSKSFDWQDSWKTKAGEVEGKINIHIFPTLGDILVIETEFVERNKPLWFKYSLLSKI